MLSTKFKISPKAAFSYEWNKGIDRNSLLVVKLGKATCAFFKSLFYKYTVHKIDVNKNFLVEKSEHEHSFFSKEYRNLIEIDISLKRSRSDSMEYVRLDRAGEERIVFDEVKRLISIGDFYGADRYLSEGTVKLLNPKSCRLLFKSMLTFNEYFSVRQRSIISKLLLTGYCDKLINLLGGGKESPLSFFGSHGIVSGLRYLLKHSVLDVNKKDENGYTPLMLAARGGWVECLQVLVDKGADSNKYSEVGFTALHYAAIDGWLECLMALLKKEDISVDIKDGNELTPLHLSAKMNSPECSKELVLNGANINAKDSNGRTPLNIACMEGNFNVVSVLLSFDKTLLNNADYDGRTPLHSAAGGGHERCVKMLLGKNDIRIDAKDNDGDTPLHHAVNNDRVGCLSTLLAGGAKVDEKSCYDDTPLECAKKMKNTVSIDLLEKAGRSRQRSR